MEASRAFVCVRPQTYEDEAEAKILSYVFAGRSGLENTSFALLDPEGKKLTRGSRSPSMTYGSVEKFAEALEKTSAKYTPKAKAIEALPGLRDLRIALNVAAADMRPLVIVRGKDAKAAAKLAAVVSKTAWAADAIGKCHYLVLDEAADLEGLAPKIGVTVVQPDPYGRGGEVLSHSAEGTKPKALGASMLAGMAKHKVDSRGHRDHVREARREGIKWESEIPVTDTGGGRKRDSGDRKRRRRDSGDGNSGDGDSGDK